MRGKQEITQNSPWRVMKMFKKSIKPRYFFFAMVKQPKYRRVFFYYFLRFLKKWIEHPVIRAVESESSYVI